MKIKNGRDKRFGLLATFSIQLTYPLGELKPE
jgi:hypothetical protein